MEELTGGEGGEIGHMPKKKSHLAQMHTLSLSLLYSV